MPLQTLPPSASAYGSVQRAEIGAAVSAVSRLWRRMGDDFDASYAVIEPQLLDVMDTAQARVSEGALAYVPGVLSETAPGLYRDLDYQIPAGTMRGTNGDGTGTDAMAYGSVLRAKHAVAKGATASQALERGGAFLTTAVGTMLSDTGRTIERMSSESRGVTTYARMLEPPSCGRCVILAGKETKRREAFDRHPRCDCRNIPAAESIAHDLTVNSTDYLESLNEDELARTLGSRANAQAYLDGADQNQLINAYRRSGSVRPAQQYSHSIKYTTEGVSRQGQAYRSMSRMRANQSLDARGRNVIKNPRLMPETVYAIAKDRADAKRLLRAYGWIL